MFAIFKHLSLTSILLFFIQPGWSILNHLLRQSIPGILKCHWILHIPPWEAVPGGISSTEAEVCLFQGIWQVLSMTSSAFSSHFAPHPPAHPSFSPKLWFYSSLFYSLFHGETRPQGKMTVESRHVDFTLSWLWLPVSIQCLTWWHTFLNAVKIGYIRNYRLTFVTDHILPVQPSSIPWGGILLESS